ncbi:proline-rich protein 2-like, partial [Branchiostoma floridae]|uniref:Proline-rich protein 2-like n=1 Tax=Branchiostoma floridae TaxID=7739 RepID=A0A9J7MK76_BRAFL
QVATVTGTQGTLSVLIGTRPAPSQSTRPRALPIPRVTGRGSFLLRSRLTGARPQTRRGCPSRNPRISRPSRSPRISRSPRTSRPSHTTLPGTPNPISPPGLSGRSLRGDPSSSPAPTRRTGPRPGGTRAPFRGSGPASPQRDQRPLLEHPDWAPSGEPEPLPPYGPGNPHDVPGNPPMEAGIPANLPMKPEPYPDFPAPEVPNNNTNTGKLADSLHPDLSRAERSLPGGTEHEARRLADLPPQGDPEPRPEADPRAPNPGEAGGATGEAGPPVLERMRHGKAPRTRGNKGMAAKLY